MCASVTSGISDRSMSSSCLTSRRSAFACETSEGEDLFTCGAISHRNHTDLIVMFRGG